MHGQGSRDVDRYFLKMAAKNSTYVDKLQSHKLGAYHPPHPGLFRLAKTSPGLTHAISNVSMPLCAQGPADGGCIVRQTSMASATITTLRIARHRLPIALPIALMRAVASASFGEGQQPLR